MPEETFFCGERHLSLEPPIELELFLAEVQIKIPPAIFQLVPFAPLCLSLPPFLSLPQVTAAALPKITLCRPIDKGKEI